MGAALLWGFRFVWEHYFLANVSIIDDRLFPSRGAGEAESKRSSFIMAARISYSAEEAATAAGGEGGEESYNSLDNHARSRAAIQ